jgi:copper chaperone NosL
MRASYLILCAFFGIFITSCEKAPKDPNRSTDVCAYCSMQLNDPLFFSQTVINNNILFFESIECLAMFSVSNTDSFQVNQSWVSNFGKNAVWIPLDKAFFAQSKLLKSPMGFGIAAFDNKKRQSDFLDLFQGKSLTWNAIQKEVN